MGVQYTMGDEWPTAVFTDAVGGDEAETLIAWLLEHPQAVVDLSACRHLHAAVLQVLLALRPKVAAWPQNAGDLGQWLSPLASPRPTPSPSPLPAGDPPPAPREAAP